MKARGAAMSDSVCSCPFPRLECPHCRNNCTACAAAREVEAVDRRSQFYNGGPARDVKGMIDATAALRDRGGLPPEASLIFSQLLLNLAGHVGRAKADELIDAFFTAADVAP